MRRALAEINLAATQRNAARLRARLTGHASLCAVVKARASGHGAAQVARAALAGGASSLAVATADEAAQLRAAGLTEVPVLVLGALSETELETAVDARADVVAWDEGFVARLGEAARRTRTSVRVHVKLDTGMGRLGTRDVDRALAVAQAVHGTEPLSLHGAMTHCATADDDLEFLDAQLERFIPFVARLRQIAPIIAHAANSAATLRAPRSHFDMVRCGIALHGCDPMNVDPDEHALEPTLRLTSYVAAVKRAAPGESVGYGRRYMAERETWIATLPIGYADGLARAHTNNGDVLIAGRRHPIVGTVSMDNVTVDLGPGSQPPAVVGEAAVLIGDSGDERITVEQLARQTGTIHHEVLCAISDRVPRRWHRDGHAVDGVSASDPLDALAQAAGERPAWLVGGAVRDRLLGRATTDFDVVVDGDPEPLARAAGRGAGGHAFALSEAFGGWRVVARDHSWQLDVLALNGATLREDLSRRDLTINAIARPLTADGAQTTDGALVDPFGGAADLEARRLVMVSEASFSADPLRVLRLARLGGQLGFAVAPATVARARQSARALTGVAPERVFAELRSLLVGPGTLDGLALMDDLHATPIVLPELAALDGIGQSQYHHLDVGAHTRSVLAETIALVDGPARMGVDAELAARLSAALSQPLANDLTRGQALRFAALLHDIAKSRTRTESEDGRVSFIGHDALGATMSREILSRLRASDRLGDHVAALTRHHLALGFLVHRMPLTRRDVYDYLTTCAPVGVDVTVLSVADRLATRGRNSERATALHLEVAQEMLGEALSYERAPPRPPLRGDELAAGLGIAPGPQIGSLLSQLTAATFAGEVTDREQALSLARKLIDAGD